MMHKLPQLNKGYTLLFAVLVSALVLSVGISILNISKKEFLLSSSSRESAVAFYAADSGLECAVYYDKRNQFTPVTYTNTMNCAESPSISAVQTPYSSGGQQYEFSIKLSQINTSCASIVVKKYTDSAGKKITEIDSSGYNMGWGGTACNVASPKKVERVLHYDYGIN